MTDPLKFLRRIWKAQPNDGYVFLTWFDEDHDWQDSHFLLTEGRVNKLALPNNGIDVYFTPCVFAKNRRRKPQARPGRWLYADLDEVDPRSIGDLPPTVAWQTSPGRYQSLWLLKDSLPPDELAKLNQKVTYHTGADKGGWSLTKVLRVPGTESHKRDKPVDVKLLWASSKTVYSAADIRKATRKTKTPATADETSTNGLKLPKATPSRIMRRRKVPARVRKLYKAKEARGDRSQRLWELESLLLKAGCTPEETLVIVRGTVWNKYQGQRREVRQLWAEINKAKSQLNGQKRSRSSKSSRGSSSSSSNSSKSRRKRRKSSTSTTKTSTNGRRRSKRKQSATDQKKLELVEYNDFIAKRLKKPGWLVEGIWSENAHGVLAGEAKTYKSVIATDLAVSVASGTPFLGNFRIPAVGPVLMIQEENDEGEFQDRLRRIAFSRGLTGGAAMRGQSLQISPDTDLPIHLLNNSSFDLTSAKDMRWLRRQCRQHEFALVVLDPFYLMTPGIDENSAAQVGPVLKRLLRLKQTYDVGIQLIHHYKKQNVVAPIYGAARMSGTGVFHRWFESAVYVEKRPDDVFTVRLLPDHRGHAPRGAIRVTFDLGTDDDLYYESRVDQAKADKAELHQRLMRLLSQKEEWTLSDLRVAMGLSSSSPLKAMLQDHGIRIKKVRLESGGRPRQVIRRPG